MNLKEIEERKAAIVVEMESEDADLDALHVEVTQLNEERSAIAEKAEKRQALITETLAG